MPIILAIFSKIPVDNPSRFLYLDVNLFADMVFLHIDLYLQPINNAHFSATSLTKENKLMDKKILLAVDDSPHSKDAVKYAVAISSTVKDLHYDLFHVQPMISHYLLDETQKSPQARAELDKVLKKNDASARKILEQYKCRDYTLACNEQSQRVLRR